MKAIVKKALPDMPIGAEIEVTIKPDEAIHLLPSTQKIWCSNVWIDTLKEFLDFEKETMITIKGKKYSEETIHEALKNHIG